MCLQKGLLFDHGVSEMGLFVSLEQKLGWLSRAHPFRRWFPICALVPGLIIWPLDIAYGQSLGMFFLLLVAYPVVAATLVGIAALYWRQWHYGFSTLLIFFALSWVVIKHGYDMHSETRWLAGSEKFKAELFAEPPASPGQLRHVDWGGWGMAGQDTESYLIFDPQDSLALAARHKESGKVPGIPCGVSYVRRLEDHWYYAVFYTNTLWEYCGDS
jgi:hypothetical protein